MGKAATFETPPTPLGLWIENSEFSLRRTLGVWIEI